MKKYEKKSIILIIIKTVILGNFNLIKLIPRSFAAGLLNKKLRFILNKMNVIELIKESHKQTGRAINPVAGESWFSPENKIPYVSDIFHFMTNNTEPGEEKMPVKCLINFIKIDR